MIHIMMKDMERACVRIFEAGSERENCNYSVMICDGIPAGVIMHDFFQKIGYENFTIYIPDRQRERIWLHMEAIKKIHSLK